MDLCSLGTALAYLSKVRLAEKTLADSGKTAFYTWEFPNLIVKCSLVVRTLDKNCYNRPSCNTDSVISLIGKPIIQFHRVVTQIF